MAAKPKKKSAKQAATTDTLGIVLQINNAQMLRDLAMKHECTNCSTCRTVSVGAITFALLAMNIAMQGKL